MVKILRENNGIEQIPTRCVKGATLPSVEEIENLPTQEERKCRGTQKAINNGLRVDNNGNGYYWLRSRDADLYSVIYITPDGYADNYQLVDCKYIGMRPVLITDISSTNLRVGDSFEFGGCTFKIISNDLALCDVIVDACCFDRDLRNDYNESDIKSKIDGWFDEIVEAMDNSIGIKSDRQIADEMDLGF